jgi:adenosylmethionine-8-amino-7-oxononanoate aminotransferase
MQNFIYPNGAARLPLVSHAQGIRIWGADGRDYIDGSSGAVSCTLGHGNQKVIAAMENQLRRVAFAYARAWESEADNRLTQRLAQLAGNGLDAAFYVSGGSEATEATIKFARQVAIARAQPQRWKIISRSPSYHGSTLGALSITGDDAFRAPFVPLMAQHPRIPAPLSYRYPNGYDAASYADFCAEELERTIVREGPETVLAFILEPIGGTATGALTAPDAYHKRVHEICKQYGLLLIHDEIMTCAGRAGLFLASHYWPDALPDLVILAKGLSSGYAPLGAMLARSDLLEEVKKSGVFAHGHTYATNPVSCAAGLAVLDELIEHDLIAKSRAVSSYLRQRLEKLKESCPIVGDVRGRGMLLAVEIVSDQATKGTFAAHLVAADRLRALCIEEGLVLLTRRTNNGAFGEWLMICPPLTISRPEVDELLARFERGLHRFIDELHRAGALATKGVGAHG